MGPRLTPLRLAVSAVTLATACRQRCAPAPALPRRRRTAERPARDDRHAARRSCRVATDTGARATPTLDALAARGVRFETAMAHAPLTGPSHASILTGLTPLGHGFRNNGGFVLAPTIKTAAEDFRKAGYRTGGRRVGLSARSPVRIRSRVRDYEDHLPRGNDPPPNAVRRASCGRQHRRGAQVAFDGCRRTDLRAGSSGCTTTIRTRRTSRRPISRTASAASPYDGEMAFVDRELGRLLKTARRDAAARTHDRARDGRSR